MAELQTRGVFLTRVTENRALCREHWRFTVSVNGFPEASPGQFVQILCRNPHAASESTGAFIRRPFSIAGLRRQGDECELDIIHRVVGPGTAWLSQLRTGDDVSFLGPLGKPFIIRNDRPIAWLVGGGVGLPPLMWLAEHLRVAHKKIIAFCGARSADLLPLTRVPGVEPSGDEGSLAYAEFGAHDAPVVVSSDDGSIGARGRIPDIFAVYADKHKDLAAGAVVYTCGPTPMMRATAQACEKRGIDCQVCLERVMACGMGTCQSCVVPVRDTAAADKWRYRLCCTDGPVFDSRVVIWDD